MSDILKDFNKPVPPEELCANGAPGKMCFMCCPACSEIYQKRDKEKEILQKAKDQIAQHYGFKDFAHFLEKVPSISFGNSLRANLLHRAAILAIQSAREEGFQWALVRNELPKADVNSPHSRYVLGSCGWSFAPEVVYYDYDADSFRCRVTDRRVSNIIFWTELPPPPDAEKLTAPGR